MKRKWTVDQLEVAVENGSEHGGTLLVADSLEILGNYGDVATLYFHLEGPNGEEEAGEYSYTFNNTRQLDDNFDELWEQVEQARQPQLTAAADH